MLAVVKAEPAPGTEIREVPKPQFGPTDVLVKVEVASICGTDLHIYQWDQWAQRRIHPPLIPGHEFCGTVEAVGNEVTSVKEGDFVSAEMHVACGKCLQCRIGEAHICQHVKIIGVDANGAFAEYVVIPESRTSGSSMPPSRGSTRRSSTRWATRCTPCWPATSPPRPSRSPVAGQSACSPSPWLEPAERRRFSPWK